MPVFRSWLGSRGQSTRAGVLALMAAAGGCGSEAPGPVRVGPVACADDGGAPDGGAVCASCAVELVTPVYEGKAHALDCTPLTHGSKPPASGTHYGSTAAFRVYTRPVPWGFLLHAMEHGAVVVAYNCPDGCAPEIAAATALWEATSKKACGRPPVIVTPDPALDARFAAAAWGHVLRAPCFDRRAFATFVERHANQAPELFAEDCGVLDREGASWCGE